MERNSDLMTTFTEHLCSPQELVRALQEWFSKHMNHNQSSRHYDEDSWEHFKQCCFDVLMFFLLIYFLKTKVCFDVFGDGPIAMLVNSVKHSRAPGEITNIQLAAEPSHLKEQSGFDSSNSSLMDEVVDDEKCDITGDDSDDCDSDENSDLNEHDILETLEAILKGKTFNEVEEDYDAVQFCEFLLDCIIDDAVNISEEYDDKVFVRKFRNITFKNVNRDLDEESTFSEVGESVDDVDDFENVLDSCESDEQIEEENIDINDDDLMSLTKTSWYLKYLQEHRKEEISIQEEYEEPESDDEEQEDPADYTPGGYHSVHIGDVYKKQYQVVRKLGWGHFSTVWLAWDVKFHKFVALKVVKSAKQYTETAVDEIKLLKCIRETDPADSFRGRTVQLLDDFIIKGVHGKHVCMVFEVLGHNLLKFIIQSNYQGIHIENVKLIIKQVLEGLSYLHSKCNIIHTDMKPENVLLCVDEANTRKLAAAATHGHMLGRQLGPSSVSSAPVKVTRIGSRVGMLRTEVTMNAEPADEFVEEEKCKDEDKLTEQKEVVSQDEDKRNNNKFDQETESKGQADRNPTDHPNDLVVSFKDNFHPIKNPVHDVCPDLEVKIADLGNACWEYHHFTEDIQTRQYRSLEVLIGAEYGSPADIWSTACMAFELATGDFLFEPHSGEEYSRDEDHLAHITELLGTIPRSVALRGKMSRQFFHKTGELRNIATLKPWPLYNVLRDKYQWGREEAKNFSAFLVPMLAFDPTERSTAEQCLEHSFLK